MVRAVALVSKYAFAALALSKLQHIPVMDCIHLMDTTSHSRREWMQLASLSALGISLPESLLAQSSTAKTAAVTASGLAPLNRFPRMMQDWLMDRIGEAEAMGETRRAKLKTREDAEGYVKDVRERISSCFGPLPEKTPLKPRITAVHERDGFRIENLIYESRPEYLVTGNVYVPKGEGTKKPAVVGVCGHSYNGKAEKAYQSFAQGLARMGYIVLIIDPVGQGERFQFLKNEPGKGLMSRYGGGTGEHIRMGNQLGLTGDFIGSWFVWDAMRAVDYLLSREDVDPQHIGVTGNSGGGTQTTWLCGLEPRFTMAAPACFVTTFRRNAENELPADTEQCPPRVLAEGLDHSDFLTAMAPKPVVILAQEKDYFDARGSQTTYDRLKRLYTLLGKPDNIRLHIGPDPHGYTQPNREAMYAFFNEVTGISNAKTEPALVIEEDPTLHCAPKGQVSELGSRTLMSFTQSAVKNIRRTVAQEISHRICQALRITAEAPVPDYRILRGSGNRNYPGKAYCHYAVETESGVHALLTRLSGETLTSRLPRDQQRAILYISHHSSDAELRSEPLIAELIASDPEVAFFACDVRGIGESRPNTCGNDTFMSHYGSDYFYAAHGVMLDRPVLGLRTHDVLSVLSLLAANGHTEIHLVGRGWGALPAAFAAVLGANVKRVTLKNHLTSYHDVAMDEDYRWPYALLPYGVLHHLDLPEVYDALKAKGLKAIEPWDSKAGLNG